jgi:hypothetical protein
MPQWSLCADAHSFPLLEMSNITRANVMKAPPDLAAKAKGDSSMGGTHSEERTPFQDAVQARPHRVSPGL